MLKLRVGFHHSGSVVPQGTVVLVVGSILGMGDGL